MRLACLLGFLALLLVSCTTPSPPATTKADVPTEVATPATTRPFTPGAVPSTATPALVPTTLVRGSVPSPTTIPATATAAVRAQTPSPLPQLGQRTKTFGCTSSSGLPDSACTPGAIFARATTDQICQPGYSRSVRDVSTAEKDQVYAEYGIVTRATGEYEVDHLVSLELGGSNDVANLWPEPANPRPGFHEKDQVENNLHDQVCSGAISLQQAQVQIATNWLDVYNHIPRPDILAPPATSAGMATLTTLTPSAPTAAVAATSTSFTVTATVSNTTPSQNQTVTVTAKLVDANGNGVPGATMHTVWHYKSTTSTCDGALTDANGTASCARDIGRATKGAPVQIDVIVTLGGQTYQAATSFIPQ
jgi:hypothetical protein